MSARTRVLAIVALAATAAVVATVGGTLLQTRGESTTAPGAVSKPRAGTPLLQLDFGVRADAQAKALANAARLYNAGKLAAAGRIFARYHSLEARIGSAFAAWPKGGLDTMKQLVAANPHSALAELHLGWAYYWSGRNADAVAAWTRTAALQPDSPYAVDAESALHPSMAPGLPFIVSTVSPPASLTKLPAAAELRALARAAERPNADSKLFYGIALWNLRHPVSAERQLSAAAKLAPDDPLIRTAAAVGAFRKDRPVAAFGKLGPLTARLPEGRRRPLPPRHPAALDGAAEEGGAPAAAGRGPVPEVRVRERGTDPDRESGERWDQVKKI